MDDKDRVQLLELSPYLHIGRRSHGVRRNKTAIPAALYILAWYFQSILRTHFQRSPKYIDKEILIQRNPAE